MTCGAQRDQVLFGITAALTTEFLVMNLQIQPCAATLASPAITPEHPLSKLFIQLRIKPQPWLFG
jgi:hypothetical protein